MRNEATGKDRTILIMSVICAALLVLVVALFLVLIGRDKDNGLSEAEVREIAQSAASNTVAGDITPASDQIVEEPKVCTCKEGTPTESIPYEGECRHEVFCAECHASKGDETCDTADGDICVVCNQIPVHEYGKAEPAENAFNEDGTSVMLHKLMCSECDEEIIELCYFDENGKCPACGNQCPHDMKLEGEKDPTATLHTEVCTVCGFTKNVPTTTDGTACATCGEVWTTGQEETFEAPVSDPEV